MNKNMRKMYTEEEIMNLISKNGGVIVEGEMSDTLEHKYYVLNNINKRNTEDSYYIYGITDNGSVIPFTVDFINQTITRQDGGESITWDSIGIELKSSITGSILAIIEL